MINFVWVKLSSREWQKVGLGLAIWLKNKQEKPQQQQNYGHY